MELIIVECLNQFDPPLARVVVAGVFLGDYPLHDYNRIKDVLGLPDIVCGTE